MELILCRKRDGDRTLRKHQSGLGGNSIGDSLSALEGDGEAPPGAVPPGEAPPGAVPPSEAPPGEATPGEAPPGAILPGEASPGVVSPGVDVWDGVKPLGSTVSITTDCVFC